jgi:[ribosomal protein S5]-alanine N-acetyltransferase
MAELIHRLFYLSVLALVAGCGAYLYVTRRKDKPDQLHTRDGSPETLKEAEGLSGMISERLRYQPLELANLDAFHGLVQDEHIRRYLMDGEVFPREWSEERVLASQTLFAQRGVGLWLVHDKTTGELVGFCGFLIFPSLHPEPQLVYAMLERFTGRGYATEMGRSSIAHARRQPGFDEIIAGVDEVNAASVRVLEKLGFERIDVQQGHFGNTFLLRLVG